jgi:glycosyltransferase involved in cell wall biosynthesis
MDIQKNIGNNNSIKKLDIGIPCFNEGKYLFRCLNSIRE